MIPSGSRQTLAPWTERGLGIAGENRSVDRRTMFDAPFTVPVQQDPLPAGVHRFPFAIDVPPWPTTHVDVDLRGAPLPKLTPGGEASLR